MTAGRKFLRVALDNDAISSVRRVNRDWFVEEEQPLFDFIQTHLSTYNRLPSEDALQEGNQTLPQQRRGRQDTVDYARDRLAQRFAHRAIAERLLALNSALSSGDSAAALNVLRDALAAAAPSMESSSYSSMSEQVGGVLTEFEFARANPGLRGVTLGWESLNEATDGAQGGDLIVIAGRPGMGKSWLMLEMLYRAWEAGHPSAFVSMEMSLRQIARRFVGRHTGANPNAIRSGELSTWAEGDLREAIPALQAGAPCYLMAGDMNKQVGGIDAMIGEFAPEILFVDAAYLLSASGNKKGYVSKWEEISMVIRELKQLAIRHDIPVVLSVQFNRNQKRKAGRRSLDLGDIAGSDSIPQDASVVLGIREGAPPFEDTQRIVEGMKNREGSDATFAINFQFNPVNLSETHYTEGAAEVEAPAPVDLAWMV